MIVFSIQSPWSNPWAFLLYNRKNRNIEKMRDNVGLNKKEKAVLKLLIMNADYNADSLAKEMVVDISHLLR